jgi:spoIIIJ-associated protein
MTEHNDTVVDDTPAIDQPTAATSETATSENPTSENPTDLTGTDGEPTEATDTVAEDTTFDDTAVEDTAEGDTESAAPRRRPAKVADLEREGEVAADFLETLLDIADLDGDIDVDVDGDRAAVSIVDSEEGRVPRRLVGQDGKVLEALQELTRLAVQSATGERSRLMLDVAGHRAERRETLVELAKTVIEQVKATGEKASLDPMTAFERKVVHDEVLAAGLTSESDGVEPRRFVVILPA